MTLRAPVAVGMVVAMLTALGLAVVAARFAADAHARPSAGSIVINRDGAISPRRTSTLTAFCPRGYVAFTWGFRTIDASLRSRFNAILLGAEPILRRTGGISGYTARFTNPNQITRPVRLSVTCVRPIDMNMRLDYGNRGVRIGRPADGASAAARKPMLAFVVKQRRKEVGPGEFTRIRQFCSSRNGPRRVPVSSSFTLGDARLAENLPIQRGDRFGWHARFANPTGTPQTVESRVVCAEGRRMAVGFAGAGRALTATHRRRGMLVDAKKTLREPIMENPFLFAGTCEKGLFSQWAHRVLDDGDPRHIPILSDWGPIPRSPYHEAMSRIVGFDYETLMSGFEAVLQPLCIKGRRHLMNRELRILFH